MVRFQPAHPVAKCQGIVLAQAFHIPDFEAGFFGSPQACADRGQFTIGKDVDVGERTASIKVLAGPNGDPVVQEGAAGFEQLPGTGKVGRKQLYAHVFEHAHTDQGVISAWLVHGSVIAYPNAAAVFQTGIGNPSVGQVGLRLAEGDPGRVGAEVLGGIDRIANPPHPHPMSSRRCPGRKRSLRQI